MGSFAPKAIWASRGARSTCRSRRGLCPILAVSHPRALCARFSVKSGPSHVPRRNITAFPQSLEHQAGSIVETYKAREDEQPKAAAQVLWDAFGRRSSEVIADGSDCLARMSQGACKAGGGVLLSPASTRSHKRRSQRSMRPKPFFCRKLSQQSGRLWRPEMARPMGRFLMAPAGPRANVGMGQPKIGRFEGLRLRAGDKRQCKPV
jgi:hypothetical protein